jgi:hypothetical protein
MFDLYCVFSEPKNSHRLLFVRLFRMLASDFTYDYEMNHFLGAAQEPWGI